MQGPWWVQDKQSTIQKFRNLWDGCCLIRIIKKQSRGYNICCWNKVNNIISKKKMRHDVMIKKMCFIDVCVIILIDCNNFL